MLNVQESPRKALVAEIRKLGQSQGLNHVFTTFLEIMATSLSSVADPIHAKERLEQYEQIIKKMEPETVSAYTRMWALLYLAVKENEEAPCDILGATYHELNLNNEWNGQYFTPDSICRLMARLANPLNEQTADGKDYIAINEPACGSGAMAIGMIWAMKSNGFDYQHKSLFVAQDIDIRCVWMAYIQLSLYRIPAVVVHGNTLTGEEWSHWYTPYAAVPLKKEDSREVRSSDCE